jgi:hypothetical protein
MIRVVREVVLALVVAITLAAPASAIAQNYAMPGGARDFRVEAQPGTGRKGPVLSGYVYNNSGYSADHVQVLVETLDASGNVTSSSTAWISGLVALNSRRYFEIPLKTPPAASYRITVVTYDIVGRGAA